MLNMSLYNDDHDDDIGPAPAGPAESAHHMTLELNCLSFCLSIYGFHPAC